MFYNCINFNQKLDNWNVKNVIYLEDMFYNTQVKVDSVKSWLPVKVNIEELKKTFGDLPLEWKVIKRILNLTDLTKKEYESLHPNCKNYLKQVIVDF
jgi:surface protein